MFSYMQVCLMKCLYPTEPEVQSATCGIVENPGIPGSIQNGGVLFPFPSIFRNGRQESLSVPGV